MFIYNKKLIMLLYIIIVYIWKLANQNKVHQKIHEKYKIQSIYSAMQILIKAVLGNQ